MRTFKVAMIWVAFLLAAVLATGCGLGSREEQGTGTTEHSAQREEPFTATPKMKGG